MRRNRGDSTVMTVLMVVLVVVLIIFIAARI